MAPRRGQWRLDGRVMADAIENASNSMLTLSDTMVFGKPNLQNCVLSSSITAFEVAAGVQNASIHLE